MVVSKHGIFYVKQIGSGDFSKTLIVALEEPPCKIKNLFCSRYKSTKCIAAYRHLVIYAGTKRVV